MNYLNQLEAIGLIDVIEREREAYRALFAEVDKPDEIEAAEAIERSIHELSSTHE